MGFRGSFHGMGEMKLLYSDSEGEEYQEMAEHAGYGQTGLSGAGDVASGSGAIEREEVVVEEVAE